MSGSQCYENPPSLSSGFTGGFDGQVEEIAGFKSYISGSPDSKLAIILISDVFGYEAPKLRKLADKVAASGFYVVVPDFLHGDPYRPEDTNRTRISWINAHHPGEASEDARKMIDALKSKGVSAIGAAGFCWGGKVVSKLSTFDGLIQAAVLLHPGLLSPEDVTEIKAPTAIVGAEIDEYCPTEQLEKYGETLSAKSIDNFVKIYPGVTHGWTLRYDDDKEHVVKCAMEAHSDMLNWFTKYMK